VRIERVIPGGSDLVRDWLAGEPSAGAFYPGSTSDGEVVRSLAETLAGSVTRAGRERVARAIRGGGAVREARLQAFIEREGLVVTTGQQPVLFGGPLYVLYKALGAIHLAERFEAALGRPVLPVFWIGSEDHDWDEARHTFVLDLKNDLREISVEDDDDRMPALHRRPIGEALGAALEAFLQFLPETDFSAPWIGILRDAVEAEDTLPRSFERILRGLLEKRGLFFLQAHEAGLKEHTAGLLLRELASARASEEALRAHADSITAAGYDLQVPILEGASNVFLEGPAGRERLMRQGEGGREGEGGFELRRSGRRLTLDEVRTAAGADLLALSPNVLLRPVVEAAFLPTLAYVAGPGEAAYLAQCAPLFERHGVQRPLVHMRPSFRLIESKVEKVLEKFELAPEALARPHHELAGSVLRDDMPASVKQALGRLRGSIARGTQELTASVVEVDPTLKASVEHVRNQGFQQIDEVEKKVVQALKRKNEIALEQLQKAQVHLYPGGAAQERMVGPWYYLFRYGEELIDRLAGSIE